MLSKIGLALQYLGLGVLPLAIVANLAAGDSFLFGVSNMLVLMVFGIAVFYTGWIVRGYGEPDEGDEEPKPPRSKGRGK